MTLLQRLLLELGISSTDTAKVVLVNNVLWQAGEMIKERRRTDEVEARFEHIQFQLALRLWNIRGIEGEKEHVENGITRKFRDDDIVADLLNKIPTKVIAG